MSICAGRTNATGTGCWLGGKGVLPVDMRGDRSCNESLCGCNSKSVELET
jgi:hypothetical protein